MTFEEWIATQDNCNAADWSSLPGAYRFWIKIARAAWQAGYADGVEAMGGPIVHVEEPNAGLPGTTEYTYEEFSRDSERW